jgi:hypothetical protein
MNKKEIGVVILSTSIMFLWGLANEYMHVVYTDLRGYAPVELVSCYSSIFEAGVILFGIMAWACALMPLIMTVVMVKKKNQQVDRNV